MPCSNKRSVVNLTQGVDKRRNYERRDKKIHLSIVYYHLFRVARRRRKKNTRKIVFKGIKASC